MLAIPAGRGDEVGIAGAGGLVLSSLSLQIVPPLFLLALFTAAGERLIGDAANSDPAPDPVEETDQ